MAEIFKEVMGHCAVVIGLSGMAMPEVVRGLLAAMVRNGDLAGDKMDEVAEAVLRREAVSSTVLANGMAFPHTRTDAVTRLYAAVGIDASGLDLNAPDGEPTHIVVLVLSPASGGCQHIQFMASLSRKLLQDDVVKNLIGAKNANTTRQLLVS